MKRGPNPGSGGRPKKAVRTVKLSVQVSEAARDNIYNQATAEGMKPGEWLSLQHEPKS
jgi:hypothetical protein